LKLLVLGIVVVTKNQKGERVDHKISIISEFLDQSGLTVICSLKKLMTSDFFKKFNLKFLSVWSDNAKHFENFTLLGFFNEIVHQTAIDTQNYDLTLIQKLNKKLFYVHPIFNIGHKIQEVYINYFIEYHGKFIVDSYFSFVQGLVEDLKKLKITIDSASALIKGFEQVIKNRKKRH